ncbi:MAG: PAS domain-containing protein [Cryobacterium sp.]|nr:PAS domain-containing protein [Oligoflexia bacterium]
MTSALPAPNFLQLFNSVPGSYLVLDHELKLVAITDELSNAAQVDREDSLGQFIFEVLPDDPNDPTGFEVWRSSLLKVLETRKPDVMPIVKYAIQRKDGGFTEKFWRPSNTPVLGRSGEVEYIIHRTEEVTELQKKEQESLEAKNKSQESEERMKFALNAAGMGDWELNLITGKAFRSLKHDQCFGYKELQPEWTLEHALRHIHPEDVERVRAAHAVTAAGKDELNFECRVIWADESLHWISARARVERNTNGHPVRMAGLVWDVTERKLAEEAVKKSSEALQRSEETFRTMMVTIPQLVWTCLPDGQCDYLSPQWAAFTGISAGEQLGLDWLDRVIFPEDRERTLVHWIGAVEGKHDYDIEYRIRRHDGAYRWFKTRGTPVRSADTGKISYWFGTCTDIDDEKKAIRDLEEQRALREKFVDSLTHDLRTPMTAGKMTAQLILRRPGDPATVSKLADRIVVNMDRADAMIRDLLDVSRIRAGEPLPLSIKECRIDQIIESTVNDLANLHGPRIRTNNEVGHVAGFWDESAVQRIVENLTGNAIKYGHEAAPVTIRLNASPEWVEFAVHNEGEVILEADQKVLFNPYRRTTTALGGGLKGWGIGLTLVKGMTEAQGGTVRVESTAALGTTFIVRLPRDSRLHV